MGHVPRPNLLKSISQVLGCSVDYLLGNGDVVSSQVQEEDGICEIDDLLLLDGKPVFVTDQEIPDTGCWALVDGGKRSLIFDRAKERKIYTYFPIKQQKMLDLEEAMSAKNIYVIPVGFDYRIKDAYSGWYTFDTSEGRVRGFYYS